MKPIFKPQTEWIPPESFPDLSKYDEIAIDLETKDPELKTMGSGSVTSKGHIVGIAVAVYDGVAVGTGDGVEVGIAVAVYVGVAIGTGDGVEVGIGEEGARVAVGVCVAS